MRTKGKGIATFIILIVAIVFIIVGKVVLGAEESKSERCTEVVNATVIDFAESTSTDDDGDETITYTPVFSYEYNNKEYESHMNTYSSDADDKFEYNKDYTIRINPSNPEEIYVEEMAAVAKLLGTIFKIIGWVLLGIMVLALLTKLVKLLILGGALGIAAKQTKEFEKQQENFYGQQQWNNMNNSQVTVDLGENQNNTSQSQDSYIDF